MKKYQKSLFESTVDWEKKKLASPKNTIRLGSLFSGIGAFEQALQILGIKTKLVFACDKDEFAKKNIPSSKKRRLVILETYTTSSIRRTRRD